MAQRFAVIGSPITHSLSPIIHQRFALQTHVQLTYEKIQGNDKTFEQQVSTFFAENGKGLNCTLPFKQKAFAMADRVTDRCQRAKAANTLWMEQGQLWADNTDGIGLVRDLSRYDSIASSRIKILLLGTGGAARGVLGPLLDLNPALVVLGCRSMEKAHALQADFQQVQCALLTQIEDQFDLIINATSASTEDNPLNISTAVFLSKPFCYDLAYKRDRPTSFVKQALSFGCLSVDGKGMLVEQAAESFFIWHKIMPETESIIEFLNGLG